MQLFLKNTLPESLTLNEKADTVLRKFLPLLQVRVIILHYAGFNPCEGYISHNLPLLIC